MKAVIIFTSTRYFVRFGLRNDKIRPASTAAQKFSFFYIR